MKRTTREQGIDMDKYSISIEDFYTRSFFLLFQDINDFSRNMNQPETEQRVSGYLAESE